MKTLLKGLFKKIIVSVVIFGMVLLYGVVPVSAIATEEEDSTYTEAEESPAAEEFDESEIPAPDEEELPQNSETEEVDADVTEEVQPDDEEEVVEVVLEDSGEEISDDDLEEVEVVKESEVEEILAVDKDIEVKEVVKTWNQVAINKYQTNEPVELGVPYIYPGDQGVEVVFTRLPENSQQLTIEKISQSAAGLDNIVSSVYDIRRILFSIAPLLWQ